jgi:tRNA(Ile)-lysidine synthase
LWQSLATVGEGQVRFDLDGFRRLLRGDQRGLVRKAIALLRPELRDIGWEHVERLLDVLASDPARRSGGPYPLVAGLAAYLDYTRLILGPETAIPTEYPRITEVQNLNPPGRLPLGPGWELVVTAVTWGPGDPPPWQGVTDPQRVWLPVDIPTPLVVRPRRPGDRLRVFGLDGRKTLTDLMNELKLPRSARATWPLLCAADGEILWLVGQRAAERCRVPPAAGRAWEARLVAGATTGAT